MTIYDRHYTGLVERILDYGERRPNRTGVDTLGVFGAEFLLYPAMEFPILTQKKVFFETAVKEMLWIYQDQSNDVGLLRSKYGVTIWDEWELPNGTIGHAYGYIVRKYQQIDKLIDGLINDPFSRRHIISLWDIGELPNMALQPCAFQTIWNVTADGFLDVQLIQRSGDVGLGVPFNTAQYAVLQAMIAQVTGLKVGILWHTITNAHIYENHVEPLQTMLEREPLHVIPRLELDSWNEDYQREKTFYEYRPEDIRLIGYDSHPHIKMEVAV